MTVHEATTDDVDEIRSVAEASWETDYPSLLSRETVKEGVEDWYGREQLVEEIKDPRTELFVTSENGDLVGFVHAIVDGKDGVILRLYVHPDHRRQGVGTELFETVRERLLDYDIDQIRAMVLAENDLGNEFYRTLGFEHVTADETTIGEERFEENTYELSVES